MTKELNETFLVLSKDCPRVGRQRGEHDSKSQRE